MASNRKSIVIVTSKPRVRDPHQLVAVQTWTNRKLVGRSSSDTVAEPVMVYAKVTKGTVSFTFL